MTISLTNRWANIELLSDSRRGEINGITVWLSFPIRVYNGRLMIHQTDLHTLIEPILYPKRLPGDRKVRSVAIDPGHGGKDPGYQLRQSSGEKIHAAARARIAGSTQKAGIKTMLTRRSDTSWSAANALTSRTALRPIYL